MASTLETPVSGTAHAGAARRVLGFVLWGAAGFAAAFAIASLPSIGLFVLPLAGAFAVAAAVVDRARGSAGALVGVGLVGLLLGAIHRGGPGLACNPVGTACREQLDPRPFVAIGLTLIVVGVLIELWVVRKLIIGTRGESGRTDA